MRSLRYDSKAPVSKESLLSTGLIPMNCSNIRVTALGKTGGFDVVNVRVLSGLQRTARPPGPSRKIELKQQNQSRGSMVRLQAKQRLARVPGVDRYNFG